MQHNRLARTGFMNSRARFVFLRLFAPRTAVKSFSDRLIFFTTDHRSHIFESSVKLFVCSFNKRSLYVFYFACMLYDHCVVQSRKFSTISLNDPVRYTQQRVCLVISVRIKSTYSAIPSLLLVLCFSPTTKTF